MYIKGKNISFIDRSNSCVSMFLHDIRKSKPISTTEEYNLWYLMRQGSQRAKDKLIFANLRYVVTIAKDYIPSGADFADLLMAGSLGITKAADRFDASLGYRFISFATRYIESEIQKVAYEYLKHKTVSLDEPLDADDSESVSMIDYLHAPSEFSSDWQIRYDHTLEAMKRQLDKEYWLGAGEMLEELVQMQEKGLPISDFTRKYHLTNQQLKQFLSMLRHESCEVHNAA